MKIGIAGYGYVGQAHEHILKEYYDIIISDPAKGYYGDLRHADAIIICVATPQKEISGHCIEKRYRKCLLSCRYRYS